MNPKAMTGTDDPFDDGAVCWYCDTRLDPRDEIILIPHPTQPRTECYACPPCAWRVLHGEPISAVPDYPPTS